MQRIPRKTRFGDEPAGSAFVDETPVVGRLGSGHEDHNRRSRACEQPARHLKAIDPRQLHIEDHDFWFEPCCGTQCVLAIGRLADDVESGLQQEIPGCTTEGGVVIDDQDRRTRHAQNAAGLRRFGLPCWHLEFEAVVLGGGSVAWRE